jgi:hypothetical protein
MSHWNAPEVRATMEGASAERGERRLRRGPTPECKTRKAKIKAKPERSRTMADKDLRQ